MRLRQKAFLSPKELSDDATVEFDVATPISKSKTQKIQTDGLPFYGTILFAVNRELKSSGFTWQNGTRTHHIADLLRDDAVSEALGQLSPQSSEEEVIRVSRRVIRKHIDRYLKRSSQAVAPDGMGESTDGDDGGDACSLGNGIVGGSSLEEADDYSLSSHRIHTESRRMFGVPRVWTQHNGELVSVPFDENQLSEKSRRNFRRVYKTTNHKVTSSGRVNLRKLRELEDMLIDRIDQQNRLRYRMKQAIAAVGLRDWKWLVEVQSRRRRGERLTGAERVRLCRIREKLSSLKKIL